MVTITNSKPTKSGTLPNIIDLKRTRNETKRYIY